MLLVSWQYREKKWKKKNKWRNHFLEVETRIRWLRKKICLLFLPAAFTPDIKSGAFFKTSCISLFYPSLTVSWLHILQTWSSLMLQFYWDYVFVQVWLQVSIFKILQKINYSQSYQTWQGNAEGNLNIDWSSFYHF